MESSCTSILLELWSLVLDNVQQEIEVRSEEPGTEPEPDPEFPGLNWVLANNDGSICSPSQSSRRKWSERPYTKTYLPVFLKRNISKARRWINRMDEKDQEDNFHLIYDHIEESDFINFMRRHRSFAPVFLTYRVRALAKGQLDIKQKRFQTQMILRYIPVSMNILYTLLKDYHDLETINYYLYFNLLELKGRYGITITIGEGENNNDIGLERLRFYLQTRMVNEPLIRGVLSHYV